MGQRSAGHRALCWVLGLVTSAFAGATLGAGPASADVTVTPGQAVQGEAAKLTFRVTEDRAPAYTTRIELRMPESAPVAETYPMSVSDWAPRIAMRKFDGTLGGIHHGQVTEVVETITWTRADAPKSGAPAELVISLGPMPQTEQMTFVVVQTYSDGVVKNWDQPPSAEVPQPDRPAPVLTLAAPPAAAGPADGGAAAPDVPEDRAALPGDDDSDGFGPLLVGLAIGLLCGLAVAGWMFLRRSRADNHAAPEPADPAGSGSGTSADPESAAPADPPGTDPSTRDRASGGGRAWRLRE